MGNVQQLIQTGHYHITHAVCTLKVTHKACRCNNFEFTFHLMTVGFWALLDFRIWNVKTKQGSKAIQFIFVRQYSCHWKAWKEFLKTWLL